MLCAALGWEDLALTVVAWSRILGRHIGLPLRYQSLPMELQDLTNCVAIDEVAPARCKTLKQAWCFTRLLATLWDSSGLKALLWEAKA